jgi:hypothetical protein
VTEVRERGCGVLEGVRVPVPVVVGVPVPVGVLVDVTVADWERVLVMVAVMVAVLDAEGVIDAVRDLVDVTVPVCDCVGVLVGVLDGVPVPDLVLDGVGVFDAVRDDVPVPDGVCVAVGRRDGVRVLVGVIDGVLVREDEIEIDGVLDGVGLGVGGSLMKQQLPYVLVQGYDDVSTRQLQFVPALPHAVPPVAWLLYHEPCPAEVYSHDAVESPLSHDHPDVFDDDGPVSPIQKGLDEARPAQELMVDVPSTAVAAVVSGMVASAPPCEAQLDAASVLVFFVLTHR